MLQKCCMLFSLFIFFSSQAVVFTSNRLSSLMTSTHEYDQTKHLFWHHKIPTIGLRKSTYEHNSFIPHFFPLWELAPRKGQGVKVAVIDTGVIVRHKNKNCFEFHTQLNHQSFFMPALLNLMNYDIQEIINDVTNKIIKQSSLSSSECQKEVMHFLYEYASSQSYSSLINFLSKHNCYTAHFIHEVKSMFDGYNKKQFFTPIKLSSSNKSIFFELLPITQNTFGMASHGTVICGLIGAREHETIGPLGIAPQAEIIMIKAFDEYGCSNKVTLLQALNKVHELGIPIVNISLKILDYWHQDDLISQKIEKIITKIPYVIAASGNSVDAHAVRHEAYPARLPSVAFDVGAFTFDGNNTYSIAPFSQYESGIGPKIVAPGFNILSTTITDDSTIEYGLFHGTSIAAAIVTGFVALIISEFGEKFTREQLLKVCYKATVKLHETNEWQTKTLLGTIDMRCALFMLHALCRFKELNGIENNNYYDFNRDFDVLLSILHTILYRISGIHKGDDLVQSKKFHKVTPYFASLMHATEYVVNEMSLLLHNDTISSFSSNIFPFLSHIAQQRIQSVFKTS